MAGRDPKKVAEAAQNLAAYQSRVHTLIVDVTKQEQVEKVIGETAEKASRLRLPL